MKKITPAIRAEAEIVPEGVSLTFCGAGHMHYKIRHGDSIVRITFRDSTKEPVVSVSKRVHK